MHFVTIDFVAISFLCFLLRLWVSSVSISLIQQRSLKLLLHSEQATYVNKRRYLWIRAAIRAGKQAWYACVQQTRLIRLSKRTKHHPSNMRTKEMLEVV